MWLYVLIHIFFPHEVEICSRHIFHHFTVFPSLILGSWILFWVLYVVSTLRGHGHRHLLSPLLFVRRAGSCGWSKNTHCIICKGQFPYFSWIDSGLPTHRLFSYFFQSFHRLVGSIMERFKKKKVLTSLFQSSQVMKLKTSNSFPGWVSPASVSMSLFLEFLKEIGSIWIAVVYNLSQVPKYVFYH